MGLLSLFIIALFLLGNTKADDGVKDYNYLMFENFVENEKTFRIEVPVVRHLKQYRNHLDKIRAKITDYLGIRDFKSVDCQNCNKTRKSTSHDAIFQLKDLIRIQSAEHKVGNKLMSYLKSLAHKFDSNLAGAFRGLVMLQETYNLDILEMANGRVSYKGKVFQAQSKLDPEDLINMASVAYNDNWYDSSIKLIKASKKLFKTQSLDIADPKTFSKTLDTMTKQIALMQNQMFTKKRARVGIDFKLLPYLVDENLEKKKQQPKWIKKIDFYNRSITDPDFFESGDKKEDVFRRVCRDELKGIYDGNYTQPSVPKCHFLHHNDPYLVLGPFKLEVYLMKPYRVVFHDFLTEAEMEWMIGYSTPRLSTSRGITKSNFEGEKHEFREGKRARTVHKTVQLWFNDIEYNEEVKYDIKNKHIHPLQDPYGYRIIIPLIYQLSKKIEMATRMNVTARFSSTLYQTTNYGLGGLCETHLDPHGYLDGVIVPDDKANLFMSGDMLATFMAWLADVPAGGGTAYSFPTKEMLVEPKRGAAAFWMDLRASGKRESVSTHGGCPILIGSKWILNKWIYYFEQWKTHPCLLDRHAYSPPFKGYYKSA